MEGVLSPIYLCMVNQNFRNLIKIRAVYKEFTGTNHKVFKKVFKGLAGH